MPRGGRRQGTRGKAYGNRTDLNGPDIVEYRGQQYGQRTAQVEAQRQTKAAIEAKNQRTPQPSSSVPGPPAPAPAVPAGPAPGTLGDLLAPTARPDQPLTAGAPFGPGTNTGSFMPSPDDQAIDRLRVVVRQTGLPSLIRLLEAWDD